MLGHFSFLATFVILARIKLYVTHIRTYTKLRIYFHLYFN